MAPSVPITVLCGFLGSGKTTLLNAMLANSSGHRIAVIVNEFGAINVDATMVRHTTERTIELSNGCICCTLRGDLLEAVDDILRTTSVDAIIIESTGIGEPIPIAQAFYVSPEVLALDPSLPSLHGRVHVDALITVVDAVDFLPLYQRSGAVPDDDAERGFGQLLSEQVEGADIILVSKTDVATKDQVDRLLPFLRMLNPTATIIAAAFGETDGTNLLFTGRFSYEAVRETEAWLDDLVNKHTPESATYGLNAIVYRTMRRFNEERLVELVRTSLPRNVLRSKGVISLVGTDAAFSWNQAGRSLSFHEVGVWENPRLAHTELVVIGTAVSEDEIDAWLEPALQ